MGSDDRWYARYRDIVVSKNGDASKVHQIKVAQKGHIGHRRYMSGQRSPDRTCRIWKWECRYFDLNQKSRSRSRRLCVNCTIKDHRGGAEDVVQLDEDWVVRSVQPAPPRVATPGVASLKNSYDRTSVLGCSLNLTSSSLGTQTRASRRCTTMHTSTRAPSVPARSRTRPCTLIAHPHTRAIARSMLHCATPTCRPLPDAATVAA